MYTIEFIKNTITGNPTNMHAFSPVVTSTIIPVNAEIDGAIRKYLAYASNPQGSEINLYYTDNLDEEWIQYSNNPILKSDLSSNIRKFRWPSTVFVDGIFHMFLNSMHTGQLERWTSVDGISYALQEIVYSGKNSSINYNVFVVFNEQTTMWDMYWRHSASSELRVTSSKDITAFSKMQYQVVLTQDKALPALTASPSVICIDNIYYLLLEGVVSSHWETFIFTSKYHDRGFVFDRSIIDTNEACAMHYFNEDKSKIYLYASKGLGDGRWIEKTYKVNITKHETN
jgi:hypothetical protein